MSEEITTLKTCLLQMQNANIDLVRQLDDCRRQCAELKELVPKSESSLESPHHIQGVVLDQLFAENKKQGERIVKLLRENAELKARLIEGPKKKLVMCERCKVVTDWYGLDRACKCGCPNFCDLDPKPQGEE